MSMETGAVSRTLTALQLANHPLTQRAVQAIRFCHSARAAERFAL